jgi:cytoskeleton protein RodZ
MDAQSDASATAGQLLHNARQAASLSLEELAARVKVPVARLQALEDDRFDSWPDMNVVRAVAAGICRHVRLDPAVVLSRLP